MDEAFTQHVLSLLPRYFGNLPSAQLLAVATRLERVRVASGELLYRERQSVDNMHFIVTGRLEVSLRDRRGERHVVAHLSAGDCVGEVALLTGQPHPADVLVRRDSVLARLARADYEEIVCLHPEAGLNIARFALRNLTSGVTEFVPRVGNIALVPLHPSVRIAEFGRRLELALLQFGSTLYLDSRLAAKHGGAAAAADATSATDQLFLDRFLDDAEKARRFVICEADAEVTDWTRTCVSHADRVLLVADAALPPRITAVEASLFAPAQNATLAERELILLHATRRTLPSGTAAWLAERTSYRHSHVAWQGNRDFNRLARLLSGNAVALVLGGGGARGFAEIGAIRAIREAGVPIDAVGGSSIGAIIGALVALDWSDEEILQSCKHAFVDDRPLDDVTVPLFSLLRGTKLARTLRHYVGEVDILDLWQPFFCVSTNLSRSAVHVHRSGTLWEALRASIGLPGLLPPVVADGELHVDGSVLENLPVGVMKRLVGGNMIAVEPAVAVEHSVATDSFPAPLEYVRSRLAGRQRATTLPKLPNLLIKCTSLGGRVGRADLNEQVDLYLDPPMRDFGFLDWQAIYEMAEVGYRYTRQELPAWIARNPRLQRLDELLEFRWSSAA